MNGNFTGEAILKKGQSNSDFGRGGELNTIIGKGTSINGNAQVQNSLRVDGKIVGNVYATETVIIGKEGGIEGEVHAKHVLLAGRVKGNIITSGKVLLENTASVTGDIHAARLVVDEGAVFDGQCTMKLNKTPGSSKSSS